MDTDARNLMIRIRDAAGEWNDEELTVEQVVLEMRDATQNQEILIRSLRTALEHAEGGREFWKGSHQKVSQTLEQVKRERDELKEEIGRLRDHSVDMRRIIRRWIQAYETAERERDEARGLLRRAEYQLVHTTPELDPTLATEIVVHLAEETDMTNDDDFTTPTEGSTAWVAELRRRCPTAEEIDALFDIADRLADIERQVLWRTEDMPEDAVGWFRGRANFPHWVIRFDTGYTDGVQVNGPVAPEFRPDEPGPLFLPILDPPEGS